ncbi:ethanolamine-phosphate cytidylyltransferase-like [Dendronephthya gigantea]|uniref:ethanolamine-phosphate cytidylyltransferase-like n=1 Tax=Dendronephthya gigantea TaxID=151771 RepID=UPI0010698E15|nr:ethanolamine-phosphate cytidylyltransferase-like [Dendronephthya gigantea]
MKPVRVWGNGCYDVFHFGHANFIRQAKIMGDYMIAGVHGDADITKNKGKPVMDQVERARMISAVRWVDEVQENIPYGNVLQTLDDYNCDFCVHGDDIARDANGNDIYQDCKERNRFRECKRTEGISTTDLIDRILLGTDMNFFGPEFSRKGSKKKSNIMPQEYYEQKIKEFTPENSRPKEGDTILYTQGVFDLLHSGQVGYLEKCKKSEENGFLIVGVLSDEEVKRVYGTYPITNAHERALALLSIRYVDQVIIGVAFDVTEDIISKHKVDYVCHGKVWDCPNDPYAVPKEKNIYRTVDSGSELTTEMIIQRIVSHAGMYYVRNTKKSESQFSGMNPNIQLQNTAN